MAEKVTLTDATTGGIIYPQTLVDSVQNEQGALLKTLLLMLDNTIAFTPTGDYQPATKKYVDDTVSSASVDIQLSTTQPTGQSAGDYWYHVTGTANLQKGG